jgi:hypothetical protein
MSRLPLALASILSIVLSGCGLAHMAARKDSGSLDVRWQGDFETARKAAASSGRPLLAVLVAGALKDEC